MKSGSKRWWPTATLYGLATTLVLLAFSPVFWPARRGSGVEPKQAEHGSRGPLQIDLSRLMIDDGGMLFVVPQPEVRPGLGLELNVTGLGHAWTRERIYDLDRCRAISIEADFWFEEPNSEFILALSENQETWNNQRSDALKFSILHGRKKVAVRSGRYPTWARAEELPDLALRAWHHLELDVDRGRVVALVDGQRIIQTPIGSKDLAGSGFLGFLGSSKMLTRVRNVRVLAL